MELGPQFPQKVSSGKHRATPGPGSPDLGKHAKDYSPGKDISASMSTSSKANYKSKHSVKPPSSPGTAGTTGPAPIQPNAGSAGKQTKAKVPSEAKPRPKQAGHARMHHIEPVETHMKSLVGFSGDKGRTVV